jgi:hypothetical protein
MVVRDALSAVKTRPQAARGKVGQIYAPGKEFTRKMRVSAVLAERSKGRQIGSNRNRDSFKFPARSQLEHKIRPRSAPRPGPARVFDSQPTSRVARCLLPAPPSKELSEFWRSRYRGRRKRSAVEIVKRVCGTQWRALSTAGSLAAASTGSRGPLSFLRHHIEPHSKSYTRSNPAAHGGWVFLFPRGRGSHDRSRKRARRVTES